MAVVFISPKKRQRTFFVAITLAFLLFLTFISLGIMSSSPPESESLIVFNKAKINIDMSIFDSPKFKNLQSPSEMGIQYKYKALTKSKIVEEGFISAGSMEKAKKILEDNGLSVTSLVEGTTGRENPFIPYYTVAPKVVVPPPATTPAATTPGVVPATTPATTPSV
jgi:hypothetical protein